MGGNVLRLARPASPAGGWTNEELAELYRVEHSLFQAGLAVETECGVSDEGDPWFVFCHRDGHVIVHAARIDGLYHLHCATLPAPLTGRSFGAIAKTFVEKLAKTQKAGPSGRVVAHPSALLSLLVAASVLSVDAVLHNSAHASELSPATHDHLSASNLAPRAPNATLARELADIFFSAVWRSPEGSGEREAIWQAVENAAVGLCALSEAPPFAHASINLTGPELSQGVRPVPEGVETPDNPSRPILADAVGASSSSAAGMDTVASSTLALTVLQPAIEAPKFLTSWEDAFSEEGATFSALGGGLPAISASIGVGAFSSPHEKTFFSSATLPPIPVDGVLLDITPTSHGETIDLNDYATGTVRIFISGGGALTVTHASAVQSIEVAEGVKAELTLSYDESTSAAPVHQTLRLDGATDVSLKLDPNPIVAAAAPTADLVVDSQGAQANDLNLVAASQDTSTDLNIKVVGSQDLALNETAVMAASSTLDASSLTGKLALGIDFGSGGTTLTDLSLGSSNLVVTPQDSVAIVNLPFSNAQIELGLNLDTVTFGYNDQPTAGESTELSVVLGNAGVTPAPVIVRCMDAAEVNSLTIISNDGGNIVNNIADSALTSLVLSGPTSLEIDAIGGIAASSAQNIVIDATSLAGNLVLNASGIVDTAVGGRQVQIDTGSGHSIITDTIYTENLSFTIGSGNSIVNIASGAEQITISGLKPTDQVNVGSVGVVDLFTNGLGPLLPHQSAIDASATLEDAAALAASFAESNAAHQALLFSYRGNAYVFVDAFGNHVFDPSADAIVKVIGATSSTELSGVFHSS
jgi:hypothetical protein